MQINAPASKVELYDALESKNKTVFYLFGCFLGVFSVTLAVAVFRQSLQLWDEARFLFNALALVATKSWIVTTYNGIPDHWYTKPPLFVWILDILMRAGFAPMTALRIPSLVAALLTVLLLFAFSAFVLRRPFVGIISALILMSSTLYIGPHVVLTGDIDATLAFFQTLLALSFWAYVENSRDSKTIWLALSTFAFAAAVLSKGIAGALFLPGMLCFALLRPQRWRVLLNWKLWLGVCLVALIAMSYYARRNTLDPGFAHDVIVNELGRYNVVVETHEGGVFYYALSLFWGFEPGAVLLLLGCFALRKSVSKDDLSRSALILSGVVTLCFLLVLTGSKTKAFWYGATALPLLSLFGALGLVDTIGFALDRLHLARPNRLINLFQFGMPLLLMLVAATALLVRMKHMAAHTRESDPVNWSNELNKLTGQVPEVHHVVVLAVVAKDESTGAKYFPVGQYWADTAARKQHIDVDFADAAAQVPGGSWVISCAPPLFQVMEERRMFARVVDSSDRCVVGLTKVTS